MNDPLPETLQLVLLQLFRLIVLHFVILLQTCYDAKRWLHFRHNQSPFTANQIESNVVFVKVIIRYHRNKIKLYPKHTFRHSSKFNATILLQWLWNVLIRNETEFLWKPAINGAFYSKKNFMVGPFYKKVFKYLWFDTSNVSTLILMLSTRISSLNHLTISHGI